MARKCTCELRRDARGVPHHTVIVTYACGHAGEFEPGGPAAQHAANAEREARRPCPACRPPLPPAEPESEPESDAVFCQHCDSGELLGYGEDIEPICDRCREAAAWDAWHTETVDRLEAAAKAGGYNWVLHGCAERSLSQYYAAWRDIDERHYRIRVSDHADAYCHDDYSIAYDSGGDDHGLDAVCEMLRQPAEQNPNHEAN